ncbi:MAG TPA: 2TM domain-containing protein [Chloroflexota bacterium]|nr:2TM domain-containing protein [Chloroflexota bacterium]
MPVDEPPREPGSFADRALAGEDERRAAEAFPRPARTKFWRHAALFLVVNALLIVANALVLPEHWVFYYVTIVWAFILGDNFLWAFVVDPDRDVAERKALQEERERERAERTL